MLVARIVYNILTVAAISSYGMQIAGITANKLITYIVITFLLFLLQRGLYEVSSYEFALFLPPKLIRYPAEWFKIAFLLGGIFLSPFLIESFLYLISATNAKAEIEIWLGVSILTAVTYLLLYAAWRMIVSAKARQLRSQQH
jgi:hypothetical protein